MRRSYNKKRFNGMGRYASRTYYMSPLMLEVYAVVTDEWQTKKEISTQGATLKALVKVGLILTSIQPGVKGEMVWRRSKAILDLNTEGEFRYNV